LTGLTKAITASFESIQKHRPFDCIFILDTITVSIS